MDNLGVENSDSAVVEKGSDESVEKVNVEEKHSVKNEPVNLESLGGSCQENGGSEVVVEGVEKGSDGFLKKIKAEEGRVGDVCGKCSVEEDMEKVSLNGVSNGSNSVGAGSSGIKNVGLVDGEGNDMKSGGAENIGCGVVNSDQLVTVAGGVADNVETNYDIKNVDSDGARNKVIESDEDESESDSESESESSSPASSSSASSIGVDEDVEDMEEGEITPEADEDAAAAGGGNSVMEPIRSKNELVVLPLVPPVNVSLLPHHQTLPVGVVSSIVGARVVVKGVERHSPLNEGSILWITESRTPLGQVDEIFGPVKNPYYIVRYNSESEVPSGIQQGTLVSFVPEFADHVLNNPSLYKKGYDASNEHDEELSDDAEFSDDEKEAEYRRMQKMKKRVTNDEKMENKKKDKRKSNNRFVAGQHDEAAGKQVQAFANKPLVHQNQQGMPMQPMQPMPVQPMQSIPMQGMPMQPMQGMPMQSMPLLQQNHPQQVFQTPYPNGVPFPQQMNMSSMMPSNLQISGGQSYYGAPFSSWPAGPVQNVVNQAPFGIGGIQGQHGPTFINVGENGVPSNGSQALQPPNNSSSNDASHNLNPSRNFTGGRQSQRRGGGRYRGGRGRHQSN